MVKTVWFDVILNFSVGAAIPLAARRQIREKNEPPFGRYFLALLLFELFVFMPIGGYLFLTYPDWSLMYVVDSKSLSALAPLGLIYFYLGGGLLGYILSFGQVSANKDKSALAILISGGLGVGIVSAAGIFRLFRVGDYLTFHSGVKLPLIFETPLLIDMMFIGAWFAIPLAIIFRKIYRGW